MQLSHLDVAGLWTISNPSLTSGMSWGKGFLLPEYTSYSHSPPTNIHPPNPSHITAKRVFLDVIIEDDEGEVEEVIVPYQLSKEAVILEMKVQDIKV